MNLSRREMLRLSLRMGLGCAAGFWPRMLRASGREAGEFTFAVLNDLHYRDVRCAPWCKALAGAVKTHRPDFCVINGDVSENGNVEQLTAVREVFSHTPLFVTIGNHDHLTDDSRRGFEEVFPERINYYFVHKGWQFVALDSTEGQRVFYTHVQEPALRWLDETLPRLDKNRPTVLLTHFPLGRRVLCRPLNAPAVLERFRDHHVNLRAVFNGHWHGYSKRQLGVATLTTNRCCSWWRTNNDGSPHKGWFLCRATAAGEITREFHILEERRRSSAA